VVLKSQKLENRCSIGVSMRTGQPRGWGSNAHLHPWFPLTFTLPESALSGQFWCIYALIGGLRVNTQIAVLTSIKMFPKHTNSSV